MRGEEAKEGKKFILFFFLESSLSLSLASSLEISPLAFSTSQPINLPLSPLHSIRVSTQNVRRRGRRRGGDRARGEGERNRRNEERRRRCHRRRRRRRRRRHGFSNPWPSARLGERPRGTRARGTSAEHFEVRWTPEHARRKGQGDARRVRENKGGRRDERRTKKNESGGEGGVL